MKLVEVIKGQKTSDETVVTAVTYAKRLGKFPIVVNDGPGFLVNRLLLPYMNEALELLSEGLAIKQIESVAKSFGMPMGPITLYDMVGPEGSKRLLDGDTIEVAPLAYMRGRTLNDSFLILDEAQNTTPEQMKMFLTRIGFGSRAVVTGDVTQVDLAAGRSGLLGLERVLTGIAGLEFVHLTSRDVVRHKIVQDIVDAYDRAAERKDGLSA